MEGSRRKKLRQIARMLTALCMIFVPDDLDRPFPVLSHRGVWPRTLPPRDTLADIVTPVGRFRLPLGYSASPISLSQGDFTKDAGGRRIVSPDVV